MRQYKKTVDPALDSHSFAVPLPQFCVLYFFAIIGTSLIGKADAFADDELAQEFANGCQPCFFGLFFTSILFMFYCFCFCFCFSIEQEPRTRSFFWRQQSCKPFFTAKKTIKQNRQRTPNKNDPRRQELFGDVPRSMLTLFQLMTLDSWTGFARPLMETQVWVGVLDQQRLSLLEMCGKKKKKHWTMLKKRLQVQVGLEIMKSEMWKLAWSCETSGPIQSWDTPGIMPVCFETLQTILNHKVWCTDLQFVILCFAKYSTDIKWWYTSLQFGHWLSNLSREADVCRSTGVRHVLWLGRLGSAWHVTIFELNAEHQVQTMASN